MDGLFLLFPEIKILKKDTFCCDYLKNGEELFAWKPKKKKNENTPEYKVLPHFLNDRNKKSVFKIFFRKQEKEREEILKSATTNYHRSFQ